MADSLVGKHFYSFAPKEQYPDAPCRIVATGGQVRSRVRDGVYLVRLVNWLSGSFEKQIIVPLEQMSGWEFYDDPDEWRSWYADVYSPQVRGYDFGKAEKQS